MTPPLFLLMPFIETLLHSQVSNFNNWVTCRTLKLMLIKHTHDPGDTWINDCGYEPHEALGYRSQRLNEMTVLFSEVCTDTAVVLSNVKQMTGPPNAIKYDTDLNWLVAMNKSKKRGLKTEASHLKAEKVIFSGDDRTGIR